jgi:formamidopyrimidine-DNA glycosylase
MPELLEVEAYRVLARRALGRPIVAVDQIDDLLLRPPLSPDALRAALTGQCFDTDRRIGKLLLLDTAAGPTLGLHFGMTGLLEVDGQRAIDRLEYASPKLDDRWVRLAVHFDDGGTLALRDQRRFGAIELDPDESHLGIDATQLTVAGLRDALGSSRAPLKARLLDQRRVAGLGNLLVDELLWRAGLDPARPAGGLSPAEMRRLHRHLQATVSELGERGGSHTGDLHLQRHRDGVCPRDGAPLSRRTVGGRTTYSCPVHQR